VRFFQRSKHFDKNLTQNLQHVIILILIFLLLTLKRNFQCFENVESDEHCLLVPENFSSPSLTVFSVKKLFLVDESQRSFRAFFSTISSLLGGAGGRSGVHLLGVPVPGVHLRQLHLQEPAGGGPTGHEDGQEDGAPFLKYRFIYPIIRYFGIFSL
jgi:hypothetical protein